MESKYKWESDGFKRYSVCINDYFTITVNFSTLVRRYHVIINGYNLHNDGKIKYFKKKSDAKKYAIRYFYNSIKDINAKLDEISKIQVEEDD